MAKTAVMMTDLILHGAFHHALLANEMLPPLEFIPPPPLPWPNSKRARVPEIRADIPAAAAAAVVIAAAAAVVIAAAAAAARPPSSPC